jgi:hypothetical protein
MSSRPQSRADVINYLKAKLGFPYYRVEITDDQFGYLIMDALNFLKDFMPGFTQQGVHMLSTIAGQNQYIMPPDIYAVIEVLSRSIYDNFFLRFPTADRSPEEISFIMGISSQSRGSAMSDMSIAMQNLSAFREMFLPKSMWIMNYNTNTLTFLSTPNTNTNAGLQNQYALLCEKTIDVDGDGSGNIYCNHYLLNYSMALAKIQLGNNLMKFTAPNLPGGLQMNAERYMTEGLAEKEKIEAEIKEKMYATTAAALAPHWG